MKRFKEIEDSYSEGKSDTKAPKVDERLLNDIKGVMELLKKDNSGFGRAAYAKMAVMNNYYRGILGYDQALKQLKR